MSIQEELLSRSPKGTSFGRATGTPFGRLNHPGADSDFHQNDMPVGTSFGSGLEVGVEESGRLVMSAANPNTDHAIIKFAGIRFLLIASLLEIIRAIRIRYRTKIY